MFVVYSVIGWLSVLVQHIWCRHIWNLSPSSTWRSPLAPNARGCLSFLLETSGLWIVDAWNAYKYVNPEIFDTSNPCKYTWIAKVREHRHETFYFNDFAICRSQGGRLNLLDGLLPTSGEEVLLWKSGPAPIFYNRATVNRAYHVNLTKILTQKVGLQETSEYHVNPLPTVRSSNKVFAELWIESVFLFDDRCSRGINTRGKGGKENLLHTEHCR